MKEMQTALYAEFGPGGEDASAPDLEREAVCPRMLMEAPGRRMGAAARIAAPLVLAGILAAGGCSAPGAPAPPEPPAASKADASAKSGIMAYGASIGASPVMASGILLHEDGWNAVCAEERNGGPEGSMRFVMGQTWSMFKENARGKAGREMLEFVNAAWNCIRLKNSYEAGDLNPDIETRKKLLSGPAMLFSSSFSASQASLASAKYFTLRELGWPASDVWIASVSSPGAGGLFFAAVARGRDGTLWALPSNPQSGIMPAEAWPRSVHPGAAASGFFAEGVCMGNLRALLQRENVGTRMEGLEGAGREARRQGSSVMPSPHSEKRLVLEPGRPVSVI